MFISLLFLPINVDWKALSLTHFISKFIT
jgi:hypothetical protein